MSDPKNPDDISATGDSAYGSDPVDNARTPRSDPFEASLAGAGTPPMQEVSPTVRQERSTVRIRRSPKLSGFGIAGVMVGVIVALVLTFAFPADAEFSPTQVFGFLLLFSAVVFGALGIVVALVIEKVSRSRAREIEADRQITNDPDAD